MLDVDNGPDFLIHGANHALYAESGLRAAYAQLAPGRHSGDLVPGAVGAAARRVAPDRLRRAREHLFDVTRGERRFAYAIYTVSRT